MGLKDGSCTDTEAVMFSGSCESGNSSGILAPWEFAPGTKSAQKQTIITYNWSILTRDRNGKVTAASFGPNMMRWD